jgi:hypothetical protein
LYKQIEFLLDRSLQEDEKVHETGNSGPNRVSGMRSGSSLDTTLVTAIARSWAAFLGVVIVGIL